MKCFIGLGSNLGDRRHNLERAATRLRGHLSNKRIEASPLVQTPALVPEGAPAAWQLPFMNGVIRIDWRGTPRELLDCLKSIERELGREPSARWAPRILDLDLLAFGSEVVREPGLEVPHNEMWNRQFVLVPIKHLQPSFKIPRESSTALERSRALKGAQPLWMGVRNLTPDSFSGPNCPFDDDFAHILDLGAESTRPGATVLTPEQEWRRLEPALERWKGEARIFRPWLSVDTYHPETARRISELGVEMLNDVSGLAHGAMLEILQGSDCQYVLMHSLTVPADPKQVLPANCDPVQEVKTWAREKLDWLAKKGVDLDRVIFDPGIGFGKTADQSWTLLRRIEEFFDLPVRILVGHSRKSFLKSLNSGEPASRDPETLGVSMQLARKGVDILRVHDPEFHHRAYRAFEETQS